jgi:8-oxo-dGTP diphosphatase
MTIVVTAAIVEDHGRYFVTRRQKGVHLEGLWEFPGGKCEPGETLGDCLRRELKEELGAEAVIGEEIWTVTHDYADRSVELHFLSCTLLNAPVPLLGQEMRWVARDELKSLKFPPADDELINVLTRTASG